MDRDFLNSLNPIFRVKDVQIIWSGNVYKVGQTNCLHTRLFVIASPGIFLIRKKSFNFQSKIITSISFFDLVSLYVTDQYASFSSKQSQIRVKLQNTKEIVSLILFIRQAQFPTDVLPLNFTFVDEEMANLFTPSQIPYQPASLFMDRMLSCILHFEIIPSNALLSEIPTQFLRRYIIQNEMLHNSLYPAWLLSLSYDRDIEIIRFKSIKLSDFLEQSHYLFAYNKFVKTVEFENVDFTNSEPILSKLFHLPHCFKPIRWVFIKCGFTKSSFSKFFNSISFIGKKIADIQFEKCTFSENILMDIFQSIFFNDCFHSINNFQFNSNIIISENAKHSKLNEISFNHDILLSQISEILCCSWVLQQKCLTHLSLVSCKVNDMTPILSQIFKFDTGLKFISLDDNNFITPIQFDSESNPSISFSLVSFRKSRLSKSFVLSLISLLKTEKVVFFGIDLSNIIVVDDNEIGKSDNKIVDEIQAENSQNNKFSENEASLSQSQETENNEHELVNNENANQSQDTNQNENKNDNQEFNQNENENLESSQNENDNQSENESQSHESSQKDSQDMKDMKLNEIQNEDVIQQRDEALFNFLLDELENLSLSSLETIFFDDNCMDSIQTLKFINFLRKQPNLKNLSVNCSFDIHDSPFGYQSFIDYCGSQNLSTLSIRGDDLLQSIGHSFGVLNLNLIQKIQLIECLDISNQRIGQKGLELLLPLIINGKLKEIYFDGSNVSSFQFLCQFCTTLLESKIKYASFPENDFNRILNFDNNSNCLSISPILDDETVSSYEDLKNKFESFFYFTSHNCSSTIISKTSARDKKISSHPALMKKYSNSFLTKKQEETNIDDDKSINSKELKIIENCIFNHKIHELYNECVGNNVFEASQTIVSLTQLIQDSLSFDNLIDSL